MHIYAHTRTLSFIYKKLVSSNEASHLPPKHASHPMDNASHPMDNNNAKQLQGWTAADVETKQREDALRNARNARSALSDAEDGKRRKVVPDDILVAVPFNKEAHAPPYDMEAHSLFRGKLAKGPNKVVTVANIDEARKRLPAPFNDPGFFTYPSAGKGFVLCGGAALAMARKDPSFIGDYDLFWIGDDFEEFKANVQDKIDGLIDLYSDYNVVLTRTQYCITATCHADNEKKLPPLIVQFVARSYMSRADIVVGFDLDACAVCYDGKELLALPRAVEAILREANLVDVDRQSETFEQRLIKYAMKKGFDIIVPSVDLRKLNFMQISSAGNSGLLALVRMSLKLKAPVEQQQASSNFSECGSGLNLSNNCGFPFAAFSAFQKVKYPIGFVSHMGASKRDSSGDICPESYGIFGKKKNKKSLVMSERIFEPLVSISTNKGAEDDLPALTKLVEGHCGCFRPTQVDWFAGV